MKINAVNFNNNGMRQKQSFGAVKEFRPGCAEAILGYSTKKVFDTISDIKGMDVWFFDKIQGATTGKDKIKMLDGCHVIVKTDRSLITEFIGTPDKKEVILAQLKKVLLWFQPESNGDAAAAIKKIDTLNVDGIRKINETYFDKDAKGAAINAAMRDATEGQRFINDFGARLQDTMESAKTTSWQDKISEIISEGIPQ